MAIYRYGQHTEQLLADAAARGSVVFSPSPLAFTPGSTVPGVRTVYQYGTHSFAYLYDATARSSVIFHPPPGAVPAVPTTQIQFQIIETDTTAFLQGPSVVFTPSPAAASIALVQPPFNLATSNPQTVPNEWLTGKLVLIEGVPQAFVAPPFVPYPPILKPQQTYVPKVIGMYVYDAQLAILQQGFGIAPPTEVAEPPAGTALPLSGVVLGVVVAQSIPGGTIYSTTGPLPIVKITVAFYTGPPPNVANASGI